MSALTPVTLEGRRVRLEPLSMQHFEGLLDIIDEPEVWQYLGIGQLNTPPRLEAWIKNVIQEPAEGRGLPFVIIEKTNHQVCGSTSLYQFVPQHKHLELGRTWLGKPYWRTGINTESKYLLLRYAFEGLGCIRVDIKTSTQNLRSQAAIQRLGATKEGVLRAYSLRQDGSISDIIMYSFIHTDWPHLKARLEGML